MGIFSNRQYKNPHCLMNVVWTKIQQKLTQQAVKVRADVEVACYTYEGIDAVKEALRAGMACSTENVPVRINLIAPPLYVITTSTPEKQEGLQILQDACKAIEDRISASGGSFNIKMAPKVVTATDEADLAKQMERAEQENAEVSGDDDDDEEEVGMGGKVKISDDEEDDDEEED